MIEKVERMAVQQLVGLHRAQLVEVLPRAEFEWAHLPGAIHLHLKKLTPQTASALDPQRPVITYCHDTECDMSPRAAVRLHGLGFTRVYDYSAGKMDWLSFGLAYEGSAVLAGDLLEHDVPTCHISDSLGVVRGKLPPDAALCVVVAEDDVVQGVLEHEALHHKADELTAEQAMRFGVSTVRPSEDAEELLERMRRRGVELVVVSNSDGQFMGTLTAGKLRDRMESH